MRHWTGLVAAGALIAGLAHAQEAAPAAAGTPAAAEASVAAEAPATTPATTTTPTTTTPTTTTPTTTTPATTAAAATGVSGGRQNAVYVGPFSLIFGGIHWEYERALSDKVTLALGVPLTLPFGVTGAVSNMTGMSIFGMGGMGAVRYYFTGSALSGLFAGPELNVSYVSVTWDNGSASGVGFGMTGLVGYSFITDSGFAVSGGAGVGVGVGGVSATAGGQTGPASQVGVVPALRLHVGYAF